VVDLDYPSFFVIVEKTLYRPALRRCRSGDSYGNDSGGRASEVRGLAELGPLRVRGPGLVIAALAGACSWREFPRRGDDVGR